MHELIREWTEGPFRLELFDTHQTGILGKTVLAYRFCTFPELLTLKRPG
jgi:hypothetical protein